MSLVQTIHQKLCIKLIILAILLIKYHNNIRDCTYLLGWEICLEFRRIQQLIQFWTFELQNFHWNFIFPIVKCVPANSEHISSSSESSPAIDSSNFMNLKTFPPSVIFLPSKKISSHISQPVDPTILNCVDVDTIPGKAILLTKI
jgi:hypothetical protein